MDSCTALFALALGVGGGILVGLLLVVAWLVMCDYGVVCRWRGHQFNPELYGVGYCLREHKNI
jgi:hypothetical protein